jgi:hypothetical protein
MILTDAITDSGFREYVRNRVPKLAAVGPIVRAMAKHGFVEPEEFRRMVFRDSLPFITATGPNPIVSANLQGGIQLTPNGTVQGATRNWLGFGDFTFTLLNVDPAAIQNFDRPARLSPQASLRGSKHKVYLAGLALLQGILTSGHLREGKGSFNPDFAALSWQQFELEAYGTIVDNFDLETI